LTEIYFIRHAEPDHSIVDDGQRPLTSKGLKDASNLVNYFNVIDISSIYSSPYTRAIQTVKPIAENKSITIQIRDNFKERISNTSWIDNTNDLNTHVRQMWQQPNIGIDGGESIKSVQERNIKELALILKENKNKKTIIGTHGTALATMISYYNKLFSGDDFLKFIGIMPYIIKMRFNNDSLKDMEEIKIE